MPFPFSAEPLSGHKNHYLINNLSEYKIIFFFHCASIWNLTDPAKKIASKGRQNFLMLLAQGRKIIVMTFQ